MEKYLKIHWSIRLVLGIIQFLLLFAMCLAIYSIVFYSEIQNTLRILDGTWVDIKNINILYPISNLLIGIGGITVIYKFFQYKRWAIILIGITVGIPLIIFSTLILISATKGSYEMIVENNDGDAWIETIIAFTIIGIIVGSIIKFSIEYLKFYFKVRNIEDIREEEFRTSKPRFLYFTLISFSPLIFLGGLMIVLYNPVIPLEVPEGYFTIEDFDLDNPIYTYQEICKRLEDDMNKFNSIEAYMSSERKETRIGTDIGRKELISWSSIAGWLTSGYYNDFVSNVSIANRMKEIKSLNEEDIEKKYPYIGNYISNKKVFSEYIMNNKEVWIEDMKIMRKNMDISSIHKIQEIIDKLPQDFNCNERNDTLLANELTSQKYNLINKVSNLMSYSIKLSVLEGDLTEALNTLQSLHNFDIKFYKNNSLSIIGEGTILAILNRELSAADYIIQYSTGTHIEQIREIYKTPFNMQKSLEKSLKGEYFYMNHILSGRINTMRDISIPYIFNGADMMNRLITLSFLPNISKAKGDTDLYDKSMKNLTINNKNLTSPQEISFINKFLGKDSYQDKKNWESIFPFYVFYNPIGKTLSNSLIHSGESVILKSTKVSQYQDYIRYELLGIKDEIQTH